MLQRIQSVFLLIAAVASVLFFVFPIAGFYGDTETVILSATGLSLQPNTSLSFSSIYAYPLIVAGVLSVIFSLVTIFMFKNRRLQMRLVSFNVVINLAILFGLFFYYVKQLQEVTGSVAEYKLAIFMPLISILFLVLANRYIKKDDKLVRSADRLR